MKKYKIVSSKSGGNFKGNDMFSAGIKYKTDKITHHGYQRFYDYFLYPYKHKEFNFFEIGVDAGRSLKM